MTLEIRSIEFSYGKEKILSGISLTVQKGEVYTLLGGSGSGKTTLMNILAGFLSPDKGKVLLDGKDITEYRPEKRGAGMVFQDYALFPHMTVFGNISFPLKVKGISGKELRARVRSLLDRIGLSGYDRRMPSELSGGERQRVALARMLASDPSYLLLDEPLSALDASLRDDLRRDLRRILKEANIPAIYVTHDQVEAMAISDRIGFLDEGRILEEGDPKQLFWRPKMTKTAIFMGVKNIFRIEGNDESSLRSRLGNVPWSGPVPDRIAFRPGSVREKGSGLAFEGIVISSEYRGGEQLLLVETSFGAIKVLSGPKKDRSIGSRVPIVVPIDELIPLMDL